MYQCLALTSLRDSHPLPTRHSRESVMHWTPIGDFPSHFVLRFRTLVSALRFPHLLVSAHQYTTVISSTIRKIISSHFNAPEWRHQHTRSTCEITRNSCLQHTTAHHGRQPLFETKLKVRGKQTASKNFQNTILQKLAETGS